MKKKIGIAFCVIAVAWISYLESRHGSPVSQVAPVDTSDGYSEMNRAYLSTWLKARQARRATRRPPVVASKPAPKQQDAALREELRKQDISALENPDPIEPSKRTFAILRLATQRDPQAFRQALELIASDDRNVRLGAIRALGYFDDPAANRALAGLLKNPDEAYRRAALLALTLSPSSGGERVRLLKGFISDKIKPKPTEFLTALGALYGAADRAEDKSAYLNQGIAFVHNTKDPTAREASVSLLAQMAPDDERVVSLLKASH